MQKVKTIVKTTAASLMLAASVAVPASAHSSTSIDNSFNHTKTVTKTKTTTYHLSECSGIINANQSNSASTVSASGSNVGQGQGQGQVGGAVLGSNDQNQNQNQSQSTGSSSASTTQSNTVNFAPNCSKTTINQVSSSQVNAPKGGVHAGAGGASTVSTGSLVGLFGSISTMGIGLALRRRFGLEV